MTIIIAPITTYSLTVSESTIIRDVDGAAIPVDPSNNDYQAYLKWLEEGNIPNPYIAPPEPTPLNPQQKLEAAGLTVEELKTLLGLS